MSSAQSAPIRRCGFCGTVGIPAGDASCCAESHGGEPIAVSVDGRAIRSVDDWFAACPPKGGARQWRDGYSAKESAKSWFRQDQLSLPLELSELLESVSDLQNFRLGTVIPEVCTKLDEHRQGRNADAIVMGVAGGRRTMIAVEAKAAEDFGPEIGSRLRYALAHTKVPLRIDSLARAVFGRPVTTLDPALAGLRYQLLHALAGALIEAKSRAADQVVLAVHYFQNARRPMDETFGDFRDFVTALVPAVELQPGRAIRVRVHGSPSVPAELPLYVGWATAPTASDEQR